MRRLPIDHCPSCGVRATSNTFCARCGVDMVDANGNARLEPARIGPHEASLWVMFAVLWLVEAALCASLALRVREDSLRWWFGVARVAFGCACLAQLSVLVLVDRIRRRAARPSLRPIAAAPEGAVHIRGRVTTLVPANGGAEDVAIRVRRLHEPVVRGRRYAWDPSDLDIAREIFDTSIAGRFVVRDASGIAVIDDDAIVVRDGRSERTTPLVTVRDGDEVEVIGPAKRAETLDTHFLGGFPLEQARSALVFCGTPAERISIVVRGSESAPQPGHSPSARTDAPAALAAQGFE